MLHLSPAGSKVLGLSRAPRVRGLVTAGTAKKKLLLVVASSYATPGTITGDTSGNAFYTRYGSSYNVALRDVAAGVPADISSYDAVWIGNSVATAQAMTAWDAISKPIIATGVRSPHTNYASATATTPAGTQATIYLKAAGVKAPMVDPALVEGALTVLDTAFTQRYTANTKLGSGAKQVACDAGTTLSNIAWSYYNAGDLMTSSVAAPGKRAWFLFHPGSIGANARGWDFMDRLVAWATA